MKDWLGALRIATLGLMIVAVGVLVMPDRASAQCPNNCAGHGTCVPVPKKNRFECECYEGWTGQACSRRAREDTKAKEPDAPLVVEEMQELDLGQGSGGGSRGERMAGVRDLEDVTLDKWDALSPQERQLLKALGWKQKTWNTKNSPRTVWPQAMYKPYNGLNKKEKAAARGFGLTPGEWNNGVHIAKLTHGTN